MNAFFGFIASPAGRVTRIIAGLALILIGLLAIPGIWGWIVAIVGAVPLLAGPGTIADSEIAAGSPPWHGAQAG